MCFIIFGLNGGEDQNSHLFNSFEEAILKIKNSRYQKKIDFERQFVKWGKSNIVRDFKVLNILSDQNVKLLLKSDDLLSINEKFNSTYFKQIKSNYFLPYYQARNEKYSFSGNAKENNYWIRNIRLGNVLDENIFICEELISLQQQGNDEQKLGQLEEALIRSFNHPKTNVYYWIMDIRQEKLEETFGEIMTLFDRVNDFTNNFNGMSRQLLPKTNSLAVSIINRSARAKKKINELGGLRFPANFNILIQNSVYE